MELAAMNQPMGATKMLKVLRRCPPFLQVSIFGLSSSIYKIFFFKVLNGLALLGCEGAHFEITEHLREHLRMSLMNRELAPVVRFSRIRRPARRQLGPSPMSTGVLLPNRCALEFEHDGHRYMAEVGSVVDGRLGEAGNAGTHVEAGARGAAITASLLFQRGSAAGPLAAVLDILASEA
jgi:hypothetical protein